MDRIVKLLIAQIGFIFLGVILAAIPCFLIMGMDIAKVYVVVSGLFLGSLLLIWYMLSKKYVRFVSLIWSPFCESNHSDYYAECLVFLLCEWTGWFVQFPGV